MNDKEALITRENLKGVDDPIAQSIQDGVQGGGLGSVLKEAEIIKHGIVAKKPPAHQAMAAPNLQDILDSPQMEEDPSNLTSGTGGADRSLVKERSTGAETSEVKNHKL